MVGHDGLRGVKRVTITCNCPIITFPASPCAPTALVLMGFFSSRRHDTDVLSSSSSAQPQSTSSPGIIRSRFVRMNHPLVLLSYLLMSLRSSALAVGQYGRNKDKGKAREANSTPNQGVTSPSRREPNVNDTLRTINGHRTTNDSGARDVSETSLHSPVSQKAPRSPGPPNNARASTDAMTHVSHSQSHTPTNVFVSGSCYRNGWPNWPRLMRRVCLSTWH